MPAPRWFQAETGGIIAVLLVADSVDGLAPHSTMCAKIHGILRGPYDALEMGSVDISEELRATSQGLKTHDEIRLNGLFGRSRTC